MVGYSDTKGDLLKRLRRAEGQVRDVLTQVSAATKALESVCRDTSDMA